MYNIWAYIRPRCLSRYPCHFKIMPIHWHNLVLSFVRSYDLDFWFVNLKRNRYAVGNHEIWVFLVVHAQREVDGSIITFWLFGTQVCGQSDSRSKCRWFFLVVNPSHNDLVQDIHRPLTRASNNKLLFHCGVKETHRVYIEMHTPAVGRTDTSAVIWWAGCDRVVRYGAAVHSQALTTVGCTTSQQHWFTAEHSLGKK